MKTRKHPSAVKRRAHHRPAKHGAARRRPALPSAELRLAAQCTVAEAESLKSELARRLPEPGPVRMDVSALERIDTAGLQLLAAFVRDRRTAGRTVEWHGCTPALESAAGLLGLHDMLELPGEARR